MRLSVFVGILVGSMFMPLGARSETRGAAVASDSEVAQDASLTQKEAGCQWRVPAKVAPIAKKGHHKRALALVPRVLFEGVSCKAIKMIAVRGDGMKVAVTSADEGTPESVASGPGRIAMVYPLIYRMFEADLTTGKVAEFGLPRFEFPDDLRPAAAVGYNRRDTLVIVATGLDKNEGTSLLQRFSPSRQGWSVLKPVGYRTDREQDPKNLCGENFLIHATLVKDLVNWCIKP